MDYSLLMELVSTVATRLAVSGAETYRVEESVRRITSAYGVDSRVYAVPHSLIITIILPDGSPLTQLCRMEHLGIDLDSVELYSNLSRRICSEKPDWTDALSWVKETENKRKKYPLWLDLLGYVLVGFGFCFFFGGSIRDAVCAGVCGLLIGLLTRFLERTNAFFQKIISSFLMAFTAYGLASAGLADHVDTCVIGALMLLVPGLLFTNALRDIIFGDTNSGINRIVEVLLIAAALSLGTAAAWNLASAFWGTPVSRDPISYSMLLQCVFSVIACTGFMIVFNIHGRGNLLCALGGGITWAAYCAAQSLGAQELFCFFVATVTAAAFAEAMARIRKYPAISYLIVSLLPLIPGAGIYYAAQEAVRGNAAAFVDKSSHTLAITGVMAVGILLIVTLTGIRRIHQQKR